MVILMADKLSAICSHIESLNLNPKSFLTHFLDHSSENCAFRRQFWGTEYGWTSTERLIQSIKGLATSIVCSEKPRSGKYPSGSYVSSSEVTEDFFTEEQRLSRNEALTDRMPFLYQLLVAKLSQDSRAVSADPSEQVNPQSSSRDCPANSCPAGDEEEGEPDMDQIAPENLWEFATPDNPALADNPPKDRVELNANDVIEYEGVGIVSTTDVADKKKLRAINMARSICAMVAFGANRRHNAFQLTNSLVFLACGVTKRVNSYLNYLGLCSSRKTAHLALKSLGREAEEKIRDSFKPENSPVLPPSICFDNLDFQQKIHMQSLDALNKALHTGTKLTIRPSMFTATLESSNHFDLTLKSQITRVVLNYVGISVDGKFSLQRDPPAVRPLDAIKPDLTMLKLMVASDNSAQGVGEVFTGIMQQAGLTPAELHSRVQIIEGDLGSCNIFESLRRQRTPARSHESSLDNVLPIPGAAHILWNIAQAILLAYWGDETNRRDTGAWRILHSLGIPAEKPVTKKDFNLMLSHMEKILEVSLLYCVLVVCEKETEQLGDILEKMTSAEIEKLVQDTFNLFCSGEALNSAKATESPAHRNFLLMIRDFATVVEAKRAMKAGDTGRLIYIWKQWAVMGQALPKLPHYSKHLPRLIVQLEHVLNTSLATVVENTLLISPHGKSNEFQATDCHLEIQNYWLKHFFNHSGIGTNINRLKDVFSINIPILRFLLQYLRLETGSKLIQQLHKNNISIISINNFLRMAQREGLNEFQPKGFIPQVNIDYYASGMENLRDEFRKGAKGLDRFRPFSPGILQMQEEIKQGVVSKMTQGGEEESDSDASKSTSNGSLA
ncbi:hypothetical protein PCASD_25057 [Puccinia coronata f. sp. avenae]|uniref:DUF6589 domain-containing protein n=1 Tax=Puccinia coronata f. sp. avenae TaxID=200324 RepID=A0A2N5SCV8_9BASI|nr:hypothetical protein PCASD_25057 [Puccinia coronata f. sp. avenae]